MAERPARPVIWSFRDARAYVQAVCDWKQAVERNFSFRKLARFAELGSPGYVQTYLQGKRNLKPETAERLGRALGLDEAELAFFTVLVAFSQADEADERARTYEQLLRLAVRHGSGRLDAARLSYFTEWYVPVIHTMATMAEFRAEPDWIAPRVVPAIRPQEAKRALDVLGELGVLACDEAGRVTVHEPVLETSDGLGGIWIREYHRAMIRLSERSLDLLPQGDRRVSGFSVTVPRAQLDEVMRWGEELLRSLFYRILALQEGDDGADGEVLQFNLQTFRLTRVQEDGR